MDTKEWGPHFWKSLFFVATGYAENENPSKFEQYYHFFKSLGHVLPCPYCRESYQEFFDDLDFSSYKNKQHGLVKFVYDMKEKINEKLRQDEIDALRTKFIQLYSLHNGDLENDPFWVQLSSSAHHICFTKPSPSFEDVLKIYQNHTVSTCSVLTKTCRKP